MDKLQQYTNNTLNLMKRICLYLVYLKLKK